MIQASATLGAIQARAPYQRREALPGDPGRCRLLRDEGARERLIIHSAEAHAPARQVGGVAPTVVVVAEVGQRQRAPAEVGEVGQDIDGNQPQCPQDDGPGEIPRRVLHFP